MGRAFGPWLVTVGAMLACAGCYLSHERPLDPVACAPFVESPEGIRTNARSVRFETTADGLTLRSLVLESIAAGRGLQVIGEVENTGTALACPDPVAAMLSVDDRRAELVELLGAPYVTGTGTIVCLEGGDRAYFRAFVEAAGDIASVRRIAYRFPAPDVRATPHPARPTLGTPSWTLDPEQPGFYRLEVPVTTSVDLLSFGAHCALFNIRCGLPVRDLPAGAAVIDGRHQTVVSQIESDTDPDTWPDLAVRCGAIPN